MDIHKKKLFVKFMFIFLFTTMFLLILSLCYFSFYGDSKRRKVSFAGDCIYFLKCEVEPASVGYGLVDFRLIVHDW